MGGMGGVALLNTGCREGVQRLQMGSGIQGKNSHTDTQIQHTQVCACVQTHAQTQTQNTHITHTHTNTYRQIHTERHTITDTDRQTDTVIPYRRLQNLYAPAQGMLSDTRFYK